MREEKYSGQKTIPFGICHRFHCVISWRSLAIVQSSWSFNRTTLIQFSSITGHILGESIVIHGSCRFSIIDLYFPLLVIQLSFLALSLIDSKMAVKVIDAVIPPLPYIWCRPWALWVHNKSYKISCFLSVSKGHWSGKAKAVAEKGTN